MTATPVYALIDTANQNGALLRAEPGGTILSSYFDGSLFQVLPDVRTVDGVTWVHVISPDGLEGWIVQDLLTAATPVPDW